jgi:ligand-binding sensor domain-containing protein
VVNGRSGLYVAGDRGVGAAGLATSLRRVFTTPGDLPGQVTDLAVDDDYLWVATLRGLVRFRLDLFGS